MPSASQNVNKRSLGMIVLLPVVFKAQVKAINVNRKKNQIGALYDFQFILVRKKSTPYF